MYMGGKPPTRSRISASSPYSDVTPESWRFHRFAGWSLITQFMRGFATAAATVSANQWP